jgi:hypothetical protein
MVYSQDKNELSKTKEKEGWQYYFDNKTEQSKIKFQEALELNPDNELSKIGLLLTSSEDELESLIDPESFFNENSPKDSMQWMTVNDILLALFMDKGTKEYLSENEIEEMKKYDEGYIYLKNILLENPFKITDEDSVIRKTGQFKNLRSVGNWVTYDYEGNKIFEYNYPEKGNLVTENQFTDNGELAKQIISEGDPLHGSSRPIKEIIYWQKNTGKEPSYLLVDKNGFVIYDKYNPVKLNENTPDNIIETVWEDEEMKSFIWKNGKKEPYPLCEEDGYYTEFVKGIKTEYRWENCKKIMISETKD